MLVQSRALVNRAVQWAEVPRGECYPCIDTSENQMRAVLEINSAGATHAQSVDVISLDYMEDLDFQ